VESNPTVRRRRFPARHLALPLAATALLAALPLATSAGTAVVPARVTALSPVTVAFSAAAPGNTAHATLLGFNDFHGSIDPPTGSGGLVNGTPAGGAEYLATAVKKLRRAAWDRGEQVVTVGAGDMVGASPLVSAAFHDEPSIEVLNELGLQLTSVGNHEFDEGTTELLRLQNGGCHPVDGCQDGDPFAGAKFQYLSANVVDKKTREPLFQPYAIRNIGGVRVGFVGMTLRGTPGIVNPAGITSVDFLDEANTANYYAGLLKGKYKVSALVLLIHEGGAQTGTDPSTCEGFAGALTPIVANLRQEYGVVVSGHTHRSYSCALPNASGRTSVVTSAGTAGVLVTDISVGLNTSTGEFTEVSARNVIAENGVRNPDGSWQTDPKGIPIRNPKLADKPVKKIADKYRAAVAPIANRVVGKISADITPAANSAGESALGDVIADAQLAYTQSAGAQIALMNPGGIRTSLVRDSSPGGEPAGDVTYGEAFAVQPFNNLVVTQALTGQQIKDVLEQQFTGFGGQTSQKILQISNGFSYGYTPAAPLGSRVFGLRLNNAPMDLAASYKVTTNDFLANGGDGFTNLTKGTGRVTAPGFDIDAFATYLGAAAPVAPGPQNRIALVVPPPA
jgi:5'-nucleotidase